MLPISVVAGIFIQHIAKKNDYSNAEVTSIESRGHFGGFWIYRVNFVCDELPDGDSFEIEADGVPEYLH
jgi:hypothetical protein